MPVQSNNDWDPLEEIIIGTADNCVHPTMNISTHSFIYGGEQYEDIKHFNGQPIAQWIMLLTGNAVPLPDFQTDALIELTFAMLGLAGLRTYEKQKGLTK